MIWFDLQPIDRPFPDQVLLAWAEIAALGFGAIKTSDLKLDRDALLNSVQMDQRFEEISELIEEPQTAFERVKELFAASIKGAAESASNFGFRYPFETGSQTGLLLQLRGDADRNIEGMIYLAMQFQQLLRHELVQVWKDEPDKPTSDGSSTFYKHFDQLFEIASAISASRHYGAIPFTIGSARSAQALLARIDAIGKIVPRIKAKPLAQLSPAQLNSNDGGVDALIVLLTETPPSARLIGATRQKSALDKKMMGGDDISRFKRFLADETAVTWNNGIFSHCEPENDGAKEGCHEANCQYFSRERVLANLNATPTGSVKEILQYMRAKREAGARLNELCKFQFESDDGRIPLAVTSEPNGV